MNPFREKFDMKVIVPNGLVLAVTSLADLEAKLKIVLLLLSIGYTAHKWIVGVRRAKRGKSFESADSNFNEKYGD